MQYDTISSPIVFLSPHLRQIQLFIMFLLSGCCNVPRRGEALEFLVEMRSLKIPFSKEVYSFSIWTYSEQIHRPLLVLDAYPWIFWG